VFSKILRKKRVVVGLSVAMLAVAGAAFAYWTTGGSGTGSGKTGTTANIVVNQTSSSTGLYPGASVALYGNFDNLTNPGPVYITAVTAKVKAFSEETIPNGLPCTQADFEITGTSNLPGSIAVGSGVGTWSGLSLKMINTAANQDNCKNISVPIEYTAS
jgi:hypothetical protein